MDCTWNECYKTKTKETTNVSLLRSYQKFLQTTTSAQKTRVTMLRLVLVFSCLQL